MSAKKAAVKPIMEMMIIREYMRCFTAIDRSPIEGRGKTVVGHVNDDDSDDNGDNDDDDNDAEHDNDGDAKADAKKIAFPSHYLC